MKLEIKSYSAEFPEYDLSIIREVPREYKDVIPDMKDAVVLDIGGHIGCFSALAVNSGAKKVIYLEPGLPSVRHARKNLAPAVKAGIVELLHGGITAERGQEEIILRYFTDAGSMAGAKTVEATNTHRKHWRGKPYTYERVKAYNFSDMLARYKPKVLKLDCEGVEYPCLFSIKTMPSHVRILIAEWHKTGGAYGIQSYLECTKKLRAWGFRPDKESSVKIEYNAEGVAVKSNLFFIRPIRWSRT